MFYLDVLTSEVIVRRDELCASNDEDGMTGARLPFPPVGHGSHAAAAGTNARLMHGKATAIGKAAKFCGGGFSPKGLRWLLRKNLRQGIASRRGHVAPALLLC